MLALTGIQYASPNFFSSSYANRLLSTATRGHTQHENKIEELRSVPLLVLKLSKHDAFTLCQNDHSGKRIFDGT